MHILSNKRTCSLLFNQQTYQLEHHYSVLIFSFAQHFYHETMSENHRLRIKEFNVAKLPIQMQFLILLFILLLQVLELISLCKQIINIFISEYRILYRLIHHVFTRIQMFHNCWSALGFVVEGVANLLVLFPDCLRGCFFSKLLICHYCLS